MPTRRSGRRASARRSTSGSAAPGSPSGSGRPTSSTWRPRCSAGQAPRPGETRDARRGDIADRRARAGPGPAGRGRSDADRCSRPGCSGTATTCTGSSPPQAYVDQPAPQDVQRAQLLDWLRRGGSDVTEIRDLMAHGLVEQVRDSPDRRRSREIGVQVLRGHAQRVLLQSGTEDAITTAREGSARLSRGRYLVPGRRRG